MTTTEINIPYALRDMRTNWYFCSMDPAKVLLAAADEIERLTLDRAAVVNHLIERLSLIHSQRDEALRERDQARREIYELRENEANRLRSAVRLKGWICFEEETP